MNSEPATILASQTRLIDSTNTGRKYRITISLPYAYFEPHAEGWPFEDALARWPVVYLLDANWFFGMVTDMVRSMAWCGSTNDAIVVGIGYPEGEHPQEAWLDGIARRNLDFTPIRSEEREKRMEEFVKRPIRTGEAKQFRLFIRDEVIPLVQQEFRADPSRRVLASHSRGANFATFALFEEPELFESYVIGSAGTSDDDGYILQREEAYAKANKNLPARVYLSAGELEEDADNTTVTDTLRFAALLESRNYDGLSLAKHIFPDLTHCEVIAPGLQAGLKFALKKTSAGS